MAGRGKMQHLGPVGPRWACWNVGDPGCRLPVAPPGSCAWKDVDPQQVWDSWWYQFQSRTVTSSPAQRSWFHDILCFLYLFVPCPPTILKRYWSLSQESVKKVNITVHHFLAYSNIFRCYHRNCCRYWLPQYQLCYQFNCLSHMENTSPRWGVGVSQWTQTCRDGELS